MSELFPEAFQVKGNESFEVQNISWFSYGDEYQSTAEQDSAIEHAVMNHDRLEQENAELREKLKYCKKAFLNQVEFDLVRDSAKQETQEIAESIHKLLNK